MWGDYNTGTPEGKVSLRYERGVLYSQEKCLGAMQSPRRWPGRRGALTPLDYHKGPPSARAIRFSSREGLHAMPQVPANVAR